MKYIIIKPLRSSLYSVSKIAGGIINEDCNGLVLLLLFNYDERISEKQ